MYQNQEQLNQAHNPHNISQDPSFYGNNPQQNQFGNQQSDQVFSNRQGMPANKSGFPVSKDSKNSRAEFGRQYGIFSKNSSIKFYCAEDKEGNPTIIVQAATKTNGKFDWDNKTVIQFMQRELPEFLVALYGLVPEVSFDNHGHSGTSKSIKMKHQPENGSFFINVIEKDKPLRAVPFSYNDAMMIASMVLSQLKKTMEVSEDQILNMAKHFILKMKYKKI